MNDTRKEHLDFLLENLDKETFINLKAIFYESLANVSVNQIQSYFKQLNKRTILSPHKLEHGCSNHEREINMRIRVLDRIIFEGMYERFGIYISNIGFRDFFEFIFSSEAIPKKYVFWASLQVNLINSIDEYYWY